MNVIPLTSSIMMKPLTQPVRFGNGGFSVGVASTATRTEPIQDTFRLGQGLFIQIDLDSFKGEEKLLNKLVLWLDQYQENLKVLQGIRLVFRPYYSIRARLCADIQLVDTENNLLDQPCRIHHGGSSFLPISTGQSWISLGVGSVKHNWWDFSGQRFMKNIVAKVLKIQAKQLKTQFQKQQQEAKIQGSLTHLQLISGEQTASSNTLEPVSSINLPLVSKETLQ